jgi:uncharacterized protein
MAHKKIILKRKPGLYLKDTGIKGRGVFCTSDIRKGEELEITPSLLMNEKATDYLDKTILINYTFDAGRVSKASREHAKIRNTSESCAVIMGVASFCNHSDEPNAEISWEEQDGRVYHTLTATKAIPKNTEICTSYGEGWFKDRE